MTKLTISPSAKPVGRLVVNVLLATLWLVSIRAVCFGAPARLPTNSTQSVAPISTNASVRLDNIAPQNYAAPAHRESSLILSEVRAHGAINRAAKSRPPELDQRLKPLGW